MTVGLAEEDEAAAQPPAETVVAPPAASEPDVDASADLAVPGRPVPAFRRFAVARAPTPGAPPEPAAPVEEPSLYAEVERAEPERALPPAAFPSPLLPWVGPVAAASVVRPPVPQPTPPVVPREPDADRVAAALRRAETADPLHASPPRDEQAELDASIGCSEWFDRRPLSRAAPAVAPVRAPIAPPEPAPAAPRPVFRAPQPLYATPEAVEPPPEFGGGDIGAGGDRLAALLVYLLLIVGPPTLGLGLAAALILARRLAQDSDDWLSTHYRFQLRTAALGLLAGVTGLLLLLVDYIDVLSALFLVLLVSWIVLRAAAGLHHLFQGRPHPNYRTWLA